MLRGVLRLLLNLSFNQNLLSKRSTQSKPL